MTSGSWLEREVTRLGLRELRPFDDGAITAIEAASGLVLDARARHFFGRVGACDSNVHVVAGPEAGRQVIFLAQDRILKYVTSEMAGRAIVPFGECLMGDLFCLTAEAIVLIDLAHERVQRVAGSFEDFLGQLSAR